MGRLFHTIFRIFFCYILFLLFFVGCSDSGIFVQPKEVAPERVIGIQPFGDFDLTLADTVAKELSRAYGLPTKVLEPIPLPKEAFVNIRSPRYRADSLIAYLRYIKPDSLYVLMGLTNQDISITKRDATGAIKKPQSKYRDFGIFGLGFRPGPSSVVSIYRYQHGNRHTFYERLFKITKHELGHNLGLPHCPNKTCIMQDAAESIGTIDRAGHFLCEDCKHRLTETNSNK